MDKATEPWFVKLDVVLLMDLVPPATSPIKSRRKAQSRVARHPNRNHRVVFEEMTGDGCECKP